MLICLPRTFDTTKPAVRTKARAAEIQKNDLFYERFIKNKKAPNHAERGSQR